MGLGAWKTQLGRGFLPSDLRVKPETMAREAFVLLPQIAWAAPELGLHFRDVSVPRLVFAILPIPDCLSLLLR